MHAPLPHALAPTLAALGRDLHARGWLPATSGALSARLSPDRVLITAPEQHKGQLTAEHFHVVGLDGATHGDSAETRLHTLLYAADPAIGAVLHVHAPYATVVSRGSPHGVVLAGWELLKAFPGVTTHEGARTVTVFPNDQDMARLAAQVAAARPGFEVPGFLLAGHGLYAWGATVDDALRHLEAFEALFHLTWLVR